MTFKETFNRAVRGLGSQKALAGTLGLTDVELSRRANGQAGWMENEIEEVIRIAGLEIADVTGHRERLSTLKGALRVILEEDEKGDGA